MKIQKTTKSQSVTTHYTESTDPEETKARKGRAERMARGEAKWSRSGRRIDGSKKEE